MSDAREALVALLWQADHAPMSTHDPRDGSCQSCPWPLHEMPPEDIADAILAAGWTPPEERTLPPVEDVARVIDPDALDGAAAAHAHARARAVLALLPGRTEGAVKAEALREAADALDRDDMTADRWYAAWLRDHAERIERDGT